jgi:hypothetical protein
MNATPFIRALCRAIRVAQAATAEVSPRVRPVTDGKSSIRYQKAFRDILRRRCLGRKTHRSI